MKFNHLLTEKEQLQNCKNKNLIVCRWKPVSEGQATAGRNIHFEMMCETCGCRTTKFMGFSEYEKHEKVIREEVNHAKTS
jgi:hypothetical protein